MATVLFYGMTGAHGERDMSYVRLDRYLADSGEGSRNDVKSLIRRGSVTVDGEIIKKPEQKIDPDTGVVCVDNRRVIFEELQYYMLNKPKGVISATSDKRDKTVIDLINGKKRRDLFPVGRLDKDTEGLLVITNDGKLANSLLSPSKHVDKTYYAKVRGKADDTTTNAFSKGVDIGDDKPTAPAVLNILKNDNKNGEWESEVYITITEGRYHQIKRMFEALDMEVIYLKRLSMGALKLDEGLKCGEYRRLTEDEVIILKGDCKIGE